MKSIVLNRMVFRTILLFGCMIVKCQLIAQSNPEISETLERVYNPGTQQTQSFMLSNIILGSLTLAGICYLYFYFNRKIKQAISQQYLRTPGEANSQEKQLKKLSQKIESNIESSINRVRHDIQNQVKELDKKIVQEYERKSHVKKIIIDHRSQEANQQENKSKETKALQAIEEDSNTFSTYLNKGFKRIYTSLPKNNLFFGRQASDNILESSVYELRISESDPERALFRLIDTDSVIEKALRFADAYIYPVCEVDGVGSIKEARQINYTYGIAQKDGNNWKLVQKAKLKFYVDGVNLEDFELEDLNSNLKPEAPPLYQDLQVQLDQIASQNKELSKTIEQFSNADLENNPVFTNLKEQLESLASRNRELDGIIGQFNGAFQEDSSKLLNLNERLDKLASHNKELNEAMEQFAIAKLEDKPEIVSIKEKILNLSNENEFLKQKMSLIEEEKSVENPVLSEFKNLLESLKLENKNLTQKLESLEKDKKEDEEKFIEYRDTIAKVFSKNELLDRSIQELKKQSKEQSPDLEKLNEQFLKKINELEQELETVKQKSKTTLSEEAIIEIIRDEGISRGDAVKLIRKELAYLARSKSEKTTEQENKSSIFKPSFDPKPKTASNKKEKLFFAVVPRNGIFYHKQLQTKFKKKETFYKIYVSLKNENKATFELVEDGETIRLALNIPDSYIMPAFDLIGDGKLTNAKEIQVTKPGNLVKDENRNWKIEMKGILKYS